MKISTFAFATAATLLSSTAFAQTVTNDADVTVVPGPSEPAVVAPAGPPRVVDPAGVVNADRTTGAAISRPPTPGVAPGARDKSRAGGQGVSDRPPGN